MPETAGSGCVYDSACGEQVYIYSYPTALGAGRNAYALYETDTAYVVIEALNGNSDLSYVQLASDSIDFTRFR